MKKLKIPKRYREATQVALIAAAGAGPLGSLSTVADVTAIAGIWGTYLYSVAKEEGYNLDKGGAVKICKSALLGMGGYYVGCKTATKIFWCIPFAGWLTAMGVSAVANILFTYRFALTICTIFKKSDGDLEIGELADNIKKMFCGNGIKDDVRQIVDIYKNG